jgi:ParB/RepB/Spo0J family partition protein
VSTPNKPDTETKAKTTRATKSAAPSRPDFFASLKARSSNMQKIAAGQSDETAEEISSDSTAETIEMITLSAIEPNPDQPRQAATTEQDAELAADIRERGILQPVIVRPLGGAGGRFELVAGERRCRAARLAGLEQIPAIVRLYDDREARTVAAIENLQRQNLEPLDEARYFKFLADEYNLSNRQIADGLHKSASYVDQRMRLLQNDRVKNTHLLHDSQEDDLSALKPWKYRPREWERLKTTLTGARAGLRQVTARQKKELQKTIAELKDELEALEKELKA